jgi:hypothetical protein
VVFAPVASILAVTLPALSYSVRDVAPAGSVTEICRSAASYS